MKFVILFLIFSWLATLFVGCNADDSGVELRSEPYEQHEIIESVEQLDEIVAQMSDNFFTSAQIRLRDISIWETLSQFYYDNQHILVLRGVSGMSIEYRIIDDIIEAEILPEYEMFMKIIIAHERGLQHNLNKEEKEVYDKATRTVRENRQATAWATVHALHTFLKDTIEFEHDHENNDSAFSVYGALIHGKAVCQGYAQAFHLLLHLAGTQSKIVTGMAGNEHHAWNLVNYGTSSLPMWYHTDVTWNDRDDGNSNRYFNVSDSVLSQTHYWLRDFFPAANSMRLNYFRYSGKTASTLFALEQLFATAHNRGETFFEFVCDFGITNADLNFLYNYVPTETLINFSIDDYGDSTLLTIVLS
jgi:hypothetical protein